MKSGLRLLPFASVILAALLLSGCTGTELASHYFKKLSGSTRQAETSGTYKVGNPYRVGSVWYYPEENFRYVETGIASWYGPDFHGGRTANGELYDQNEMTAAHRTLQMPSYVRVTNLENGRSVVVRINDRGPYLHGRVIDVSKRAAELLGMIGRGTARVRLEVLEKESRQVAAAARRGMDTSRMNFADLEKMPQAEVQPTVQSTEFTRGPQVASLGNDVPESLKTPTITVEELNRPGAVSADTAPPKWSGQQPDFRPAPLSTHLSRGRYVPDPVVSHTPVQPTGLFVQAGSFAVQANAQQLSQRLSGIARTSIEPVTANGRTLYRVRLGPLASVAAADAVLEKVIRAGGSGAKVVKNK